MLGVNSLKSIRPFICLYLQSSRFYRPRSEKGANAETQETVWNCEQVVSHVGWSLAVPSIPHMINGDLFPPNNSL